MHHSASDHATHDQTLIAGHAAGDLTNLDTAAAAALLSTCSTCAELHRDLVAISTATRALPQSAHAPRDFRLTAEQAARLRRGSWLRGLLRPFASARSATRPMAAAFTSFGVAGLLVAAFAPSFLGSAASAPQRESFGGGQAATSAPAAIGAAPTSAAAPGPAESWGDAYVITKGGPDDSGRYVAGAAGSPTTDEGAGNPGVGGLGGRVTNQGGEIVATASQPNLLLLGSIGLLLTGLALYGLRFAARRLR
jgi:hypothetical protein